LLRAIPDGAADLEFQAVGVTEEQRQFFSELLNLSDLLRSSGLKPTSDAFEGGSRIDREGEVVDCPSVPWAPALADYLLGWHLEDIEGGAAADVDDFHPRVIVTRLYFEDDLGVEGGFIEMDGAVHVAGECGDVIETGRDRHHRPG
jgi:hypothetical protein